MRSSTIARAAAPWLVGLLLVPVSPALAPAAQEDPSPEAPPKVELVERILAVVDERPLLLSEVRALQKVRGLDGDTALQAAIDEQLMFAEASRVSQAEVSPEQEQTALAELLKKEPALATAVPEPDLKRLLHRQLAILQYVQFRFQPQVHASDEEVRKAWEREEVGRPAGPALEDVLEATRARLERQMLDERIEAWIGELRARAEIRHVGAPPPREGSSGSGEP